MPWNYFRYAASSVTTSVFDQPFFEVGVDGLQPLFVSLAVTLCCSESEREQSVMSIKSVGGEVKAGKNRQSACWLL